MGYGKKGKPIVIEQPSLTEVESKLAQTSNLGQASLFGVEPKENDQTTDLNTYFDELATKGIRYANFDKEGEYDVSNPLTNAHKVLKLGTAKIKKKNKNNWFTHISKSPRNFNGKINIKAIDFKQIAKAIKLNRTVKIATIGDSISTNGRKTANLKLRTVRTASNSLGDVNAPDGLVESASYTSELMNMMVNQFPNNTFEFSNFAIGGEVVSNWNASRSIEVDGVWYTKTWIDYCKDVSPDLLIVGFGMNHVNNDQSKVFSYDLKSLIDYVKANFNPTPDIVIVTSPRSAYVISDSTFGSFSTHSSIHMTANIGRAIGQEYGAYVCDVARISDIKRTGLDFTKPILKKMALSDFTITPNGFVTDNGNGTYNFQSGASLQLNDNFLKDFQIKLKLNFTVAASSSTNQFGIRFNKTMSGFYENQVAIYPKFTDNLARIMSSMRIADNARYNPFTTTTFVDGVAYESTDVDVTITKQGSIIEVKLGSPESRVIRDYVDCWDTPGYIDFTYNTQNANESVVVKSIEVFGAEYPEYLPSLLDEELFGEYVAGDYSVKAPYGGNGVNHPTSIGIEECYVPALTEMVRDIKEAVYTKTSFKTKIVTPWTSIPANSSVEIEVVQSDIKSTFIIEANPVGTIPSKLLPKAIARDGKVIMKVYNIGSTDTALVDTEWNVIVNM